MSNDQVNARLGERARDRNFLFGWRDVTTAIAERTMVPCIIPKCGAGDTFLLAFTERSPRLLTCIYANWSALSFDYATRQKIAYVHLKYNIVKQLPTISPDFYSEACLAFVGPKVIELTYTSHAMAAFARDLGHNGPPFPWDEERRAVLRADLDAFYARAYGLTRDELRYILDPADVMGSGYPSETFRVLKDKETRQFGEYRTRRLVLAAWDRMEASGEFRELGL